MEIQPPMAPRLGDESSAAASQKAPSKKATYLSPDPKGIPLKFLILAHEKYSSPNSLKGNLGDAFLYKENPVFRNVRDEYLRRGFRFTTRDFCHYHALPLLALDEIIDAGKIPYLNNVSWLLKLHELAPGKYTCSELQYLIIRYNYLFHESAHLIAHQVLFNGESLRLIPKNAPSLLRILLAESFANTAEALSSLFAKGVFGPFFLRANSYYVLEAQGLEPLIHLVQSQGFLAAARVLFAALVYSNFLYCAFEEEEFAKIREFAGLEKNVDVEAVAKIAFALSMRFRVVTTPLHLVKIGFDWDLKEMVELDPLAALLAPEGVDLRRQLDLLIEVLCRDIGVVEALSGMLPTAQPGQGT